MARIIFPETFADQVKLIGTVRAKHNADGGASILNPYLTKFIIDLNVDFTNMGSANTHNNTHEQYNRLAEEQAKTRDVKSVDAFSHMRGGAQALKIYYKDNVRQLGEWGITVDGKARLVYPSNFSEMVKIFRLFKAKNDTYAGASSPLNTFLTEQNINLNTDSANIDIAEQQETAHIQTMKDAEDEKQERDNLANPVITHLRGIGEWIVKNKKGKEKDAGDWGYVVDDSKQAPKLKTSTIKLLSQKTLDGVVIGGTLTNIGPVDVHVYKGKTTTGTPTIVPPNGQMGMAKGFSSITVVNPSNLQTAKIKVLSLK